MRFNYWVQESLPSFGQDCLTASWGLFLKVPDLRKKVKKWHSDKGVLEAKALALGKNLTQSALTVARRQKCLSSLLKADLFIAGIATRSTSRKGFN